MSDDVVFDAQEAADFLRVDKKTLVKLIKDGSIKAARVGRMYRIHKSVLVNFIKGESNE